MCVCVCVVPHMEKVSTEILVGVVCLLAVCADVCLLLVDQALYRNDLPPEFPPGHLPARTLGQELFVCSKATEERGGWRRQRMSVKKARANCWGFVVSVDSDCAPLAFGTRQEGKQMRVDCGTMLHNPICVCGSEIGCFSPVISDMSGCCDQPWVLKSVLSENIDGGRPCSLTSGVGIFPSWLVCGSYGAAALFPPLKSTLPNSTELKLVPCGAFFNPWRDRSADPWAESSFMAGSKLGLESLAAAGVRLPGRRSLESQSDSVK